MLVVFFFFFFFSSRRRHTRWTGDWSSDVCSSDLLAVGRIGVNGDDGNAGGDGLFNVTAHEFRAGGRNQDTGGLTLEQLLERQLLRLWIVRIGTDDLRFHLHLRRSFQKSRTRCLPVPYLGVGTD